MVGPQPNAVRGVTRDHGRGAGRINADGDEPLASPSVGLTGAAFELRVGVEGGSADTDIVGATGAICELGDAEEDVAVKARERFGMVPGTASR